MEAMDSTDEDQLKIYLKAKLRQAFLEKVEFGERLDFQVLTMVKVDNIEKINMVIEDTALISNKSEELSNLRRSELFGLCLSTEPSIFRDVGLAFLKPIVDCDSQTDEVEKLMPKKSVMDCDTQTDEIAELFPKKPVMDCNTQTDVIVELFPKKVPLKETFDMCVQTDPMESVVTTPMCAVVKDFVHASVQTDKVHDSSAVKYPVESIETTFKEVEYPVELVETLSKEAKDHVEFMETTPKEVKDSVESVQTTHTLLKDFVHKLVQTDEVQDSLTEKQHVHTSVQTDSPSQESEDIIKTFTESEEETRKKSWPLKKLVVSLTPIEIKEEKEDIGYNLPSIGSDGDYGSDTETEDTVVIPEIPISDNEEKTSSKQDEMTCPLCPAKFRSQKGAEKHLRVKHDIGNVYICKICQDICPSNTAMHEHMRTKHAVQDEQKEKPLKKRGRKPLPRNLKKTKAPLIQKKSVPLSKPKIKIRGIKGIKVRAARSERPLKPKGKSKSKYSSGGEPVECQQCSKIYQSSRALRRHVSTVHEDHTFDCKICGKEFQSKETLYHHKRGIHGDSKPYSCEECGASFNFNHSLRLHLLKHSGKRPHQCPECDKTYLTSNHLKMHIQGVHRNKKNYSCKFCGKSFSYTTSLRVHEMTHGDYRPYKCSECGNGFINSHSLKYHTESKHAVNQWFTCDICGKKYKTEFLMKTHRRRHTADGSRYMCDICGRQFMYKSTLDIHAAVHSEEKAFQCSTCGKSFKTYATLYSHQYVHKTDSPHLCSECGKAFKTKERCKAHQRRHSGLKPFECEECGRCFPDKGGLSKHKKTVHCIEKRFVCNFCGKACSRADNLRVHMKIHDKNTHNPNMSGSTPSTEKKRTVAKLTTLNSRVDIGNTTTHTVNTLNRMETDLERMTGAPGYERLMETVMDRTLDKINIMDHQKASYSHSGANNNAPPAPNTPSSTPGAESLTNMSNTPPLSPPVTRVYQEPPGHFNPTTSDTGPSHMPHPLSVPLPAHEHMASSVMMPPTNPGGPHPTPVSLHPHTHPSTYMYMWPPYMAHNAPSSSQTPDSNNYY